MRLASHLDQPLQRVKRETTSSEFVEWIAYLDHIEEEKATKREKWEHYIALLRMELAASRGVEANLNDCYVNIERQKPMTKEEKKKQRELRILQAKIDAALSYGADPSVLFK